MVKKSITRVNYKKCEIHISYKLTRGRVKEIYKPLTLILSNIFIEQGCSL